MDLGIHGRGSQRAAGRNSSIPSEQGLLMEIWLLLLEQGVSREWPGVRCSWGALERCHIHGHAHLVLGEGARAGDAGEGRRQRGLGAAGTQHQPRSQGQHRHPLRPCSLPRQAGSTPNTHT